MYARDGKEYDVRIAEKAILSLSEAAAYTGIGVNKIRQLSDSPNCNFVLYVGSRRTIKRKLFEEYLMSQYSV